MFANRMSVALVAAAPLMLGFAIPAHAQSPLFSATPIVAATGNLVAGDVLWSCGADGCTTRAATSRPAIVCAQAAKKMGKLDRFAANGALFDADALAKCNAKAKDSTTTLARN